MELKRDQELWIKGVVDRQGDIVFMDSSGSYVDHISRCDAFRLTIRTDDTPTIPEFVKEWIERIRDKALNLFDAYQSLIDDERVKEWFIKPANFDLFAHAWLNGYELKKEKLYIIELPNGQGLVETSIGKHYFSSLSIDEEFYVQKTEEEFEKAGYAWAFEKGFAKEVMEK